MDSDLENELWLSGTRTTGPSHVSLRIQLSTNTVRDVTVERTYMPPYEPEISNDAVSESVVRGCQKANHIYGTDLHPISIIYKVDGSNPLLQIQNLTFSIVEKFILPRFSTELQNAVHSFNGTLNKLSKSTNVSKTKLANIAKSGNVNDIEQRNLAKLLLHFGIVHDEQ